MRKTKIICTIGPATNNQVAIEELMKVGMNAARLNFSHTNWNEQSKIVKMLKDARKKMRRPLSIILDTKGPEIRLGKFTNKTFLEENSQFILTSKDVLGNENIASVSYKNLVNEIKVNDKILLDDGAIKLEVESIIDDEIKCNVLNSGYIDSNKSVNVPGVKLNIPALTEKDLEDIDGAIKNEVDYIALSFVRKKEDVLTVKKILVENKSSIKIISKLENREGIDNFDEILKVSDGIMIARGDLGVEIPFYEVPIIQKDIIKKTIKQGKFVITATQMMESMINNPTPTRAEVSDVANAIYDGTSAIMLSGETAVGKYPYECVNAMHEIAINVENSIDYDKRFQNREYNKEHYEYITNHAMITAGINAGVKAICAYTYEGNTPQIISSFLPKVPIYVITSNEQIYNQLALSWGLIPYLESEEKEAKKMILDNIYMLKKNNLLSLGDTILIAGGKYIPGDNRDMNKSLGGLYKLK